MSKSSSYYANSVITYRFRLLCVAITTLIIPAYAAVPTEPYHVDCMPFPKHRHNEWPQVPEDYKWDPAAHLQVEKPSFVKNLDFESVDGLEMGDPNLAYSDAFRVVSPEGNRLLLETINAHKHHIKGNARQQGILRGLGYFSQYIEDFLHDETFLGEISKIAGEPLCPSTFGSHITQVNFGKPGAGGEVDKWHFDSVDYVLVIILSDIEDMVGGKLETLEKNLGGREAVLQMAAEGGVPEEYVRQQSYAHSGYGVLCQGSKIMHRVTPVLEAKEDRISFVISFAKTNVFGEDNTRTLKYCKDPYDVTAWEMARHEAWRQSGVLKYLIEESDPNIIKADDIAQMLDNCADRLKRAARIIRHEEDDAVAWLKTDSSGKSHAGDTTPTNENDKDDIHLSEETSNASRIPDPEALKTKTVEPETTGSFFSGLKRNYRLLINATEL